MKELNKLTKELTNFSPSFINLLTERRFFSKLKCDCNHQSYLIPIKNKGDIYSILSDFLVDKEIKL